MPMQWKDFKGMLMLYQSKPGGMFISYPNAGEPISGLKTRIVRSIAQMFVHDEKKSASISWLLSSVPTHPRDKGDLAEVRLYDADDQSLQIVLYEREYDDLTVVYGHFARKSKTSKDPDDSSEFLDEKGKGSKVFDKLWKSFN
jgi:hypothetical protein